jgi:serine incorporator 1/3
MGLLALRPSTARWLYLSGFLVSALVSWALRDYGAPGLKVAPALAKGCGSGSGAGGAAALLAAPSAAQRACLGKSAVLRVAFGSAVFFAAHSLSLLCVTRTGSPRLLLHTGCPPLQLAAWAALAGSGFALPAAAVSGFGHVARIGAGLFVLLQSLILLECVFSANASLVERSEEGSTAASVLLIVGSLVSFGAALAGLVLLFVFWAPRASCSLSTFVLAETLVGMLAFTAVSLTPCRQKAAGLFTSAAMAAWTVFLAWGALASLPPGFECAPREALLVSSSGESGGKMRTNGSVLALRIASLVMTLLSLCHATFSASASHAALSTASAAERGEDKPGGDGSDAGADAEGDAELSHRPDFFHATFALAACYLAMILVSWSWAAAGSREDPEGLLLVVDRSMASFGVKVASLILSQVLYLAALLAPAVCTGREFN